MKCDFSSSSSIIIRRTFDGVWREVLPESPSTCFCVNVSPALFFLHFLPPFHPPPKPANNPRHANAKSTAKSFFVFVFLAEKGKKLSEELGAASRTHKYWKFLLAQFEPMSLWFDVISRRTANDEAEKRIVMIKHAQRLHLSLPFLAAQFFPKQLDNDRRSRGSFFLLFASFIPFRISGSLQYFLLSQQLFGLCGRE